MSFSLPLPLTSSAAGSKARGWKEWRLGWPQGFGREQAENTFQILLKSLPVVCSLEPLLSPAGFPPLFISSCFSVSLLPSQAPQLVQESLPLFLPASSHQVPPRFQAPLSASASVRPSLCPSPSVHLSLSVPLPICLVVCVSPLKGTYLLLRHTPPGQQRLPPSPHPWLPGCKGGCSNYSFWKLH